MALANKYKTNTYVWFNLLNEPIWSQPVTDSLAVHTDLRHAILAPAPHLPHPPGRRAMGTRVTFRRPVD